MPDFHQQLQDAIATVRKEMPDVADVPTSYDPTLPSTKGAVTNEHGVTFGPGATGGTSAYLENLTAHELTHARQQKATPLWLDDFKRLFGPHFDYGNDPRELEAFQAASDRAITHHQTATPQPGFEGGFQRGDITLPTRTGVGNRYHP